MKQMQFFLINNSFLIRKIIIDSLRFLNVEI